MGPAREDGRHGRVHGCGRGPASERRWPVPGGQTHISVVDAETLFHEFGHVLDFTIGIRRSAALDDAWWGRDWVEGPSFSMGFWGRAPTVMASYARHPGTGQPVPAPLLEALDL